MKIDFFKTLNSEDSILVESINSNCEPCAMIEPTLQQIKNSVGKRIKIFILEVEDVPDVVSYYNIDMVPTTALFSKGELIWKTSEVLSKQKILEKILEVV